MQNILGIDVSKNEHDLILVKEGKRYHRVISNDSKGFASLVSWLNRHHVTHVHACMEATGQYGEALAEYLYDLGHLVSVMNPARVKRYGQSKLHRNKNDKADAKLIAEFCLKEKPGTWEPLSPEIKHLRALIRRLEALKTNLRQEKNRKESGEKDPWVVEDLNNHIEYLEERIKATEIEINNLIKQSPELKPQYDLLTSIPGIGFFLASTLLGEIGDFSAFENAPQLAAYAGLTPRSYRSGSSVLKKSLITKEGRVELRRCLYMPAVSALRCNSVIQSLAERMKKTNHHKMEIVVAAMRKLLHLAYGVLKTQKPFDPNYSAQFNFGS
jgi:transposase